MTRHNGLYLAAAIPLASLLWDQATFAPACLVGAVVACVALLLPGPRRQRPAPTITRLPTPFERREGQTRWLPGLGFGFSLFHWPPRPFLFLSVFRWRRPK